MTAAQDESYRRLARQEDRSNLDGGLTATTSEEFLAYVQLARLVGESNPVAALQRPEDVVSRESQGKSGVHSTGASMKSASFQPPCPQAVPDPRRG